MADLEKESMKSRKYILVLFWNIAMIASVALQILISKLGVKVAFGGTSTPIVFPLTDITIIAAVLTGVYFGVNVLTKVMSGSGIFDSSAVQQVIDGMKSSEDMTSSKFASKKYFLTIYWAIYMVLLMIAQFFVSEVQLPTMQATWASGILTLGYFGINLADKAVAAKTETPAIVTSQVLQEDKPGK